ncbi:MAG: hypothetical protein J6V76_06365 [Bacteroidales bacterium]|nr:hypothetical protein [Bacteroidales bacterium]MBO7142713.1 hypothetical protein [Bacteroidales bacterium]
MMKAKMIFAAAALVVAAASAQAQEARYEFEKAVITTKTEMMGNPMITTYYISDYGKQEASEFKMDMSAMGGNVMNMRSVTQADGAVQFDINAKEGRKIDGQVNFLNLTPEVVKKHKIKEKGEEIINGRPCKKYEVNTEQMGMSVSSTVWIWKGFPVKTVVDGGMFQIETVMDTFDENGTIPEGIFEVPADVKIR